MGKKSVKKNKNIYQICREGLELTREKASELLETISADRIEKIESGKSLPRPDEVIRMCKKLPYWSKICTSDFHERTFSNYT